jgi:hypothetical protein
MSSCYPMLSSRLVIEGCQPGLPFKVVIQGGHLGWSSWVATGVVIRGHHQGLSSCVFIWFRHQVMFFDVVILLCHPGRHL